MKDYKLFTPSNTAANQPLKPVMPDSYPVSVPHQVSRMGILAHQETNNEANQPQKPVVASPEGARQSHDQSPEPKQMPDNEIDKKCNLEPPTDKPTEDHSNPAQANPPENSLQETEGCDSEGLLRAEPNNGVSTSGAVGENPLDSPAEATPREGQGEGDKSTKNEGDYNGPLSRGEIQRRLREARRQEKLNRLQDKDGLYRPNTSGFDIQINKPDDKDTNKPDTTPPDTS